MQVRGNVLRYLLNEPTGEEGGELQAPQVGLPLQNGFDQHPCQGSGVEGDLRLGTEREGGGGGGRGGRK